MISKVTMTKSQRMGKPLCYLEAYEHKLPPLFEARLKKGAVQ